jgi:glycosyltransferase involved in cell wall biosynthesis
LRILITNNALRAHGGTEVYVRDLALGLLARGHVPICYSTELGETAAEIRDATIPVVDDLDMVGAPPDVIHGHHHLETMTALLRFPGVPAVYVCHGWSPWPEIPPRFPRIRRYVAVSEACRDHVVLERGVPAERVTILLNFVNLDRFPPRDALPVRPARALLFSNAATEGGFVPAVREACARSQIALDVVGLANGNPLANPGPTLGRYDLVFARGKAALEAAAVGCAVVLCDYAGVGPMVTADNVERIRALNFGQRAMRDPIDASVLAREIQRYDASDAAEVSRRLRRSAGHDSVVDALVGLYAEAVEEQARQGCDHEAEGRGRRLPPLADAARQARRRR